MANGKRQTNEAEQQLALQRLTWLLTKTESGLTVDEVGARMGMKQPALSRLRHSDQPHTPSPSICRLIAYVYHERRRELAVDAPAASPA